ncbi:MAG: sugar phosphate isomerase/epimerase [Thermodesulfovibrionales bacterium]|nr:sugar phosphate isomerase/epimerase [Thermodesulfovibrionales bacterium]
MLKVNKPHIHIPFERIDDFLNLAIQHEINMEIFFKGAVLDTIEPYQVTALRKRLTYNPDISIHAPFMDLSPGAIDDKIRAVTIERFQQTLEMAHILQARAIVFHSGYEKWKYALDTNLWLEKSLETWLPLNEKASRLGIKIAIENIFEDEPSNLKLLMEAVNSKNFGICFDTGHFNIFSQTPLSLWLETLRPYMIELHVHDNDKSFDQHKPIGEGNFEFSNFFNTLDISNLILTLENHSPEDVFKSLQALSEL